MKRDIGFRFDEKTHERLSALAQEWGCTRTAVIERLVAIDPIVLESTPSVPIPTYPPGKPITQAQHNEIATVLAKDKVAEMRAPKPLTRAEREARNLAFQKQTGMSGGKKK